METSPYLVYTKATDTNSSEGWSQSLLPSLSYFMMKFSNGTLCHVICQGQILKSVCICLNDQGQCNGLHVFMCCTCQETNVNTVSLDSGDLPVACKNISTTVEMSTTARHDHLIPHVHTHTHTHSHRSSNERNKNKTGYLKRCSTPTSSASSAPISLGTWSNVLVVGEPSWNITFTVTQ